jgi:signal transduction histidine kinase
MTETKISNQYLDNPTFSVKRLVFIVLVAIAVFIIFQVYSVNNFATNKQRLNQIKSVHFPVLEKINRNMVLLDKLQETFLQSVMMAEDEVLDQNHHRLDELDDGFNQIRQLMPEYENEIEILRNELQAYAELATETSIFLIKNPQNSTDALFLTERMNETLQILQVDIKSFQETSYIYFIDTLNDSKNDADLNLYFGLAIGMVNLLFMVILIYFMRNNIKMVELVAQQNETLESRVQRRTTELEFAHDELIKSEKMAALGGLVSGVAHEVNTPLGVGITAASHLDVEVKQFAKSFAQGGVKKSSLINFISELQDGLKILQGNLMRAAQLVKSFKQVAVDQSTEEKRSLVLDEYLDEVLSSLAPKWKHSKVNVETDFAKKIQITTYPGFLAQIITNLLDNALIHAFGDDVIHCNINISLKAVNLGVMIIISDNGKGMSQEIQEKVFDPFFTTRRGSGGSGLGMHIVYNLVTQKLQGQVNCESCEGEGASFTITLPYELTE